ncbi:MAG: 50S ribosomal protein L9 [Firmicutes bacterium]|nr:50S ribosomal protein L9 [Bacillota bacterium]
MKILLLEDVKKLGKAGEIVDVSDGYAKNFIIPKKLGREATKDVLNNWKQQKASEANRKKIEKQQAIATVKDLETKVITLKEKAGKDGRLFGSVTAKDLAEALKKQYGLDVDRKKINLKDPIRAVGNYSVEIKLQAEASGNMTVQILPQE